MEPGERVRKNPSILIKTSKKSDKLGKRVRGERIIIEESISDEEEVKEVKEEVKEEIIKPVPRRKRVIVDESKEKSSILQIKKETVTYSSQISINKIENEKERKDVSLLSNKIYSDIILNIKLLDIKKVEALELSSLMANKYILGLTYENDIEEQISDIAKTIYKL